MIFRTSFLLLISAHLLNIAVVAAVKDGLSAGTIVAVFTPYYKNTAYKINLEVIPAYAEHLAEHNVTGVIVVGIPGEGDLLDLCETKALVRAWMREAKHHGFQVLVGLGGQSTLTTFAVVRFCDSIGVDAIVVHHQSPYGPQTVQEAVTGLQLLASLAPSLPIVYYDNAEITGVKLNTAKFFKLATEKIPNFVGVLCAINKALNVIAFNSLRVDQHLLVYYYDSIQAASTFGFSSSTIAANLFPGIVVGVEKAVKDGDKDTATKLQTRINLLVKPIYNQRNYLGLLKAAFSILTGIEVGPPRPPIISSTYEQRRNITQYWEDLNVELKSPVL